MKDLMLTTAALTVALIVVASTRLIFPAMGLIYEFILASFEPTEPEPQLAIAPAAAAVVVTEEVTPKPRATRKRRTTKTTAIKTNANTSAKPSAG